MTYLGSREQQETFSAPICYFFLFFLVSHFQILLFLTLNFPKGSRNTRNNASSWDEKGIEALRGKEWERKRIDDANVVRGFNAITVVRCTYSSRGHNYAWKVDWRLICVRKGKIFISFPFLHFPSSTFLSIPMQL